MIMEKVEVVEEQTYPSGYIFLVLNFSFILLSSLLQNI